MVSEDGAQIGFRRLGAGPVVVLVHGAGQTAESFRILAEDLASDFSVIVVDRRGRGRSPDYGRYAGLRTEVADLRAVLEATGARNVFGLSSGAVIAIETARIATAAIDRLALYEPPLSFDGVVHGEWVPRYEEFMAAGRPGRALATVTKATADRPVGRLMPAPLLGALLDFAIRHTEGGPAPDGTLSPSALARTIHYDGMTVRQAAGPLDRFSQLPCRVLLLGGTRSARNLTASLDGLAAVLPHVDRVTIPLAGHTAADDSKKPHAVAAALQTFFRH